MVLTIDYHDEMVRPVKEKHIRIKGTTETSYAVHTRMDRLLGVSVHNYTASDRSMVVDTGAFVSGWVSISGLTAGDDVSVIAWGFG